MAQTATIKVVRSGRVIVPKSRLSYPHLFKPSAFQDEGEAKYSAAFLVLKSEEAFIKTLRAEQDKTVKELYGSKPPANFERWGIFDGDESDDEAAAGCWIVKAKNKVRPKVIDKDGIEILDELEVYGGCYVRASVQAKAYGTPAKGGVTLELLVVQKVADGEPFSGAAKNIAAAADELGAYEEEEFAY